MRSVIEGGWGDRRSAWPIRGIELDELDVLRVEIEDCGGGGGVEPPAAFSRVDDQRITPRLHLLDVGASVDDHGMLSGGHGSDVADVVDEQNALAPDLHAMR